MVTTRYVDHSHQACSRCRTGSRLIGQNGTKSRPLCLKDHGTNQGLSLHTPHTNTHARQSMGWKVELGRSMQRKNPPGYQRATNNLVILVHKALSPLKFIFGKSYRPHILQIKLVIFIKKQKYFKIEIELPSLVLLTCQCPTMLFVALAWCFPFSIQPSAPPTRTCQDSRQVLGPSQPLQINIYFHTIQYAGLFVFELSDCSPCIRYVYLINKVH
jgi:hypothetical protein